MTPESAYRDFWAGVGDRFPDLGGAASTDYYARNEQRLFEEHFPPLPGLTILKTDLWDEAKNTRILAWASAHGAKAFGVDISPPAPEEPRDGLLFVGRFVPKKGLGTLIVALQQLRAEGREPETVLVGDGPEASALKAAAAGLTRLRFAGWQPPEEVARLMRRAALLAVPSIRAPGGDAEGLPSVAVEAMAAGLPVVASDEAGLAGVVQPGETGVLVPARDPAALAAAIGVHL